MLAGRPPAPDWLDVDAGDDCAVVDRTEAVTVDALVEGVHFDGRLSPEDVGFKAIAVSVSDLAAMGARPRWVVVALSLPTLPDPTPWVDGLARGLDQAARRFGVHRIGGDLTAGPVRSISTTAAGRCVAAPLRRSGAAPGQILWVTGVVGLAGAGWMFDDPDPTALSALRRPAPPVAFALDLAAAGHATAAMDLSDGLGADLPRLARASGVAAHLDADALPTPPCLVDHPRRLAAQIGGGEDYQLLFTSPPERSGAIRALASRHAITVTAIGRIAAGAGVHLVGAAWPEAAFAHFPVGA